MRLRPNGGAVSTNYYVEAPSCANACEHCTATERFHLGKSSVGWRFLFYAEPDWPRDEAFAHWVRRALYGRIVDEYGDEYSLARLLDRAANKADGIAHTKPHPGPQFWTPTAHDFLSCGHDFTDREFS